MNLKVTAIKMIKRRLRRMALQIRDKELIQSVAAPVRIQMSRKKSLQRLPSHKFHPQTSSSNVLMKTNLMLSCNRPTKRVHHLNRKHDLEEKEISSANGHMKNSEISVVNLSKRRRVR